ncbi:glutathione transferase GstA [Methylobacter tundripaludum]|uniref:Glutathione S-transferase domain protein n=1 Tax=Methylobacter tundripaludum (strain ATCC BAA-1195 / DSM 17260 / SV96) TaxID=697282 RepID=G3J0R1_METTV|nr:glutathione transferase GstA [Methylobacter tundripaludum]EGW20783.1 Glutathione S-transferase domain protein [Methylobacter tundripaludum SV96]
MKLYYSKGACSLSPHIVACEAELPIELIEVDLQIKRTEIGEDFRLINPNGYVPVLILDDGNKLMEGPAIVQYLADQAPDKELVPPAGTFERYQLQQWLNFISTEIHKGGFAPLFNSATPEAAKKMAIATLTSRLETVAEHLSNRAFLLGEQFTVADAYLFVMLGWGAYVDVDISRWPVLADYAAKISARPAVQKALKEEGLV